MVKERLREAQESFREDKKRPGGEKTGWLKPSNMHLTLSFLGEIEADTAKRIGAGLAGALATRVPFKVSTESIELKGNKTLWVGFKESAPLTELKDSIDAELQALGIKKESRLFRPHLTLIRIRDRERARRIKRRLKEIDPTLEIEFQVEGVKFMESVLGPGGARHSVILDIPFVRN